MKENINLTPAAEALAPATDAIPTTDAIPAFTLTLMENAYFKAMKKRCYEYKYACVARNMRLNEIRDWNNPEFQRLWAEKQTAMEPYTPGQRAAYNAWCLSIRLRSSELEIEKLPYEKHMSEFVDALRDAGFTEVVVTDDTSWLMSGMHELAKQGCTMMGLCEITRGKNGYGEEETTNVQGIRFAL